MASESLFCAGIIMTAVQFSTLFLGSPPTNYYLFFSIVEIIGRNSLRIIQTRKQNTFFGCGVCQAGDDRYSGYQSA